MKYSVVYTMENGLKKSSEKKDAGPDGDLERDNNSYAGFGIRHLQSLLLALAVFSGYLQRVNLAVTIVAITNIRRNDTTDDESVNDVPIYSWDNEVRGYILSAFFIGYLITNFPAAIIGVHLSNKLLLFFTFLANGILNILTPFLIEFEYRGSNQCLKYLVDAAGVGNWRALIVLRAIEGILQAFMFPTLHSISARWAPPHERSQLVGFIMSGIPFGTMFTLAGSGIIASTYGWPSVFYISGLAGILWAILWLVLGSDNPAHCRLISADERDYIEKYIPVNSVESKRKVPWTSVLTSWPVWAIVVAHTGHNWGFWLLLSEMPTFIHEVLGLNIKSDGFMSALPYLVMWLLQFPVMYIADELVKRRILSISFSRKLWNTIDGNVIHCYCNLPSCITTSYMCKSEANENGCFKKFDVATQQIHCGCLEQSIKSQCSNSVDTSANLSLDEEHPFHCCYSDMCNNEASEKQFSTIQSASIHINESDEEKLKEILSVKNVNYRISSSSYVNTDTWFRAIMIAVPVLGLMILVKLVEVAFRLLKSDTSEERRSTAKLVNQNYDFSANNNAKLSLTSIPETHSYRSYLIPKCSVFDSKFFFVFRQQDKSQNTKNAKYVYVSPDQESNNNCAPRVPEKFSKQNLNILKLPYKFNKLKDKSSKNVNVGVSNSNCYNLINPVTLNSNLLDVKRI